MRTSAEWKALSESVTLRGQAFIAGEFRDAVSGETFPSINPAAETKLADIASCDTADVDLAVTAARKAFDSGVWSDLAPGDRKRILLRFADLVEKHGDELAVLDSLDMGKPISEMISVDVPDSIDCLRWTAESIDKLYGEIAPTGNDTLGLISHEPAGVVAAITPWNYPLMMASWKIAPALAAGNSVILKPSEKSALSVLRLAELAKEAGIPDGVFNVLPGFGHTAGKALALHNDVNVLAFTGSSRVGGLLMEYAGQSNLKRVWIEAGGKSPMLVFEDCEDIEKAASTAAAAIFSNQGEVCIACSRLYVQSSIRERFTEALIEAAKVYRPRNPLDPETRMGALVDKTQLETVAGYIQSAIDEGARVLTGGVPVSTPGKGYFVEPTIIGDAQNHMRFVQEEIFGPVLAVGEFSDEAEAIRLANDNRYGLGASVWTANLSRAHRVSRKIQSGMVWVNGWGGGDSTMPFGGMKASGYGRDKSLHSLEKYTDLKTVWISL
ncbi:aldehyde dehydrogenase [Marinobacter nanhaiticus D15-8W]|uniref:Aldehyde dehydrogenase n=1 Tax=Marinobacter nanhaiticus D15-8W TaxID=626887 RepID=N6WYW2_9GAMM|nr:aldehyde dehydrogenase [Marinobacter nanhaiticus]ENO13978.1 aldehyde dehydrogenase [Marinobacter nanhaiticus D15-8W]BES71356.1 aldehyde dehydrogenase [Marinobacter nanhaiticus D15-8W]